MLCSTIIPTIGRSTLTRTVESALSQNIDEHEVIVVNDSGKILPPHGWMDLPRVTVINANRAGVTFACNIGAAVARGTYINFLHDDDYLLAGGLGAMIETAETTGCRWIIGAAQVVDEEGAPLRVAESRSSGNILAEIFAGESAHMSYTLIEREAFLNAGGFDPLIKIYEDRDLCWRLAWQHDVNSTPQQVACVRVSGSPQSAFDFGTMPFFHRMIRERILNTPEALNRLRDSARHKKAIRARVCQQCIYSAALNLRAGRVWTTLSRCTWCLRVGGLSLLSPSVWYGVLRRLRASIA